MTNWPPLPSRQIGPKREYLFDGDYEWLNEEPEPSWIAKLARIMFVSAMALFVIALVIQTDHFISKRLGREEKTPQEAGASRGAMTSIVSRSLPVAPIQSTKNIGGRK